METVKHLNPIQSKPVKMSLRQLALLPILILGISGNAQAISYRYITDSFEVTMRSGTSTSNSIVRMLDSGERLTVLEEDLASKYSLVKTSEGKRGYVLTRFLNKIPSAKQRLEKLQQKSSKQSASIQTRDDEIKQLTTDLSSERTDNEALKDTLLASENELTKVRSAAENTLSILDENQRLNLIVDELRGDKLTLSDENEALKDSTKMDWFIRGAAVSILAFLLGIIVTRISWKKKDSWGSY